jgi:hypothetical protein
VLLGPDCFSSSLEQTSVAPGQLRPVSDLLVQVDSFLDGVPDWSPPWYALTYSSPLWHYRSTSSTTSSPYNSRR